MHDVLREIIDYKCEFVNMRKTARPQASLDLTKFKPRGFANALRKKAINKQNAIIAEIKKASPSAGLIRADFDHVKIAKIYEDAGAACISVLTDEKYFKGALSYLADVRDACDLPLLRKDFIIDEYQIYEAAAAGADCILLIVAALETPELIELEICAHDLGLDVLVEVHDASELEIALANLKSDLIGINNRNLKTLEIDTNTSLELRSMIPENKIAICESGLRSGADTKRMNEADIYAFLIGEAIMKEPDMAAKLKEFL